MSREDLLELARFQMKLVAMTSRKGSEYTYSPRTVSMTRVVDGLSRSVDLDVNMLIHLALLGHIDVSAAAGTPDEQTAAYRANIQEHLRELGWLKTDEPPPKGPKRRKVKDSSADRLVARLKAGGEMPTKYHAMVLAAFEHAGDYGLTDFELDQELGAAGSRWRTRRSELAQAGILVDSHERRRVADRLRAIWKLARYAGGAKDEHPDGPAK